MQIFNVHRVTLRAVAAAFGLLLPSSHAFADSTVVKSSPLEVFQEGQRAAKQGHADLAIMSYELAAQKGVLGAQLALARIYATGEGGPHDEGRALYYYKQIAKAYVDTDPSHPIAIYIAEAFRAAANYYRTGIPSAGIEPDAAEAARLMLHAASYFQDRAAQYELGMMYLTGEGVDKNPKMAVTWLLNAARKRYAPAQARLGDMLWSGREVKHSPAEGLAMLAIARDNAGPQERKWIEALYNNALGKADVTIVNGANVLLNTIGHTYRNKEETALRIVMPAPPETARPDSAFTASKPETRSQALADSGKTAVIGGNTPTAASAAEPATQVEAGNNQTGLSGGFSMTGNENATPLPGMR